MILDDHAEELDVIAEALYDRETLTAADLEALVPGQPSSREPIVLRRLASFPTEAARWPAVKSVGAWAMKVPAAMPSL